MSWYLVLQVAEWLARLVMLPVVTLKRRPNSAMAWLVVIFFQPWVGIVLYWLFGEYRLPRRRAAEHAQLRERLNALGRRFENHPYLVHPQLGAQARAAVTLAEQLASMPILGGNAVELLSNTDALVSRLVADIDLARHHVHLLFYIFADDATGRRVIEALGRAVRRGVRCRVLVDAVGSRPWLRPLRQRMLAAGVEFVECLPVNPFRRRMARIDLRNHRKAAIIDGAVAYTGSQNIVDADYGRGGQAWRDMMARLTGPVVLELQIVFVEDWYYETEEIILDEPHVFSEPRRTGETLVQALPSGPDYPVENYQRVVVAAIYGADERVVITTPYFVPDEPLLQAIQVAVLRGVEVTLIVPERCDQVLVGAAARAYYDDVLSAGARLFLYTGGLLHSKTMTVDDSFALLGSSNFDIRSFALNFELNLLFYGPDMAARLRTEQERYLDHSRPLTLDDYRRRWWAVRLAERIARLLSPLL